MFAKGFDFSEFLPFPYLERVSTAMVESRKNNRSLQEFKGETIDSYCT